MNQEQEVLEQEQSSSRYSQKELDDLIYNGIRPEGMDFEEFKFKRKYTKAKLKEKLRGEMFHLSRWLDPIEGTKYYRKMTKTYIKEKEDGSV